MAEYNLTTRPNQQEGYLDVVDASGKYSPLVECLDEDIALIFAASPDLRTSLQFCIEELEMFSQSLYKKKGDIVTCKICGVKAVFKVGRFRFEHNEEFWCHRTVKIITDAMRAVSKSYGESDILFKPQKAERS